MKKFSFKKIKWKNLLISILGIAIILVIVAVVVALARRDTKSISASAFERGALDAQGVYVKDEQAIYTKEAFECRGLRIAPDFEFDGTYDVYYYDEVGKILDSKTGLKGIYDEDYPFATHARVVIHPTPVVKDGKKASDFKIKFWEVAKYAKMLDITVLRDQIGPYETTNLYNDDIVQMNKSFDQGTWVSPIQIVDSEFDKVVGAIPVDCDTYDIYVRNSGEYVDSSINAVITDAGLNVFERENMSCKFNGEWQLITISVPNDAEGDLSLYVRMPAGSECYIFGYNK